MSPRRLLGAFLALACVSMVVITSPAVAAHSSEATSFHHNPQLGRLEVKHLHLVYDRPAWSAWRFEPGPATVMHPTTTISLAEQFSGDCGADWHTELSRGNAKSLGLDHAPHDTFQQPGPLSWHHVDTDLSRRDVKICWYLHNGSSGGLVMSSVFARTGPTR